MKQSLRVFHRRVAPWLALPLLVTLSAGMAYRLGRAWFGMTKETGDKVLEIHIGEWLGDWGSSAYVLVVGLGLLALALSGLTLMLKRRGKENPRVLHRILGAIVLLPLAVTAVTGMAFHFGEHYFSDATGALLMGIHQGSWLGPVLRPFYVLFNGLGLLAMIGTGLAMTGIFKKKYV